MTCGEAEALLVDAGDGRLDLPAAMRLSAHLEGCAGCRVRAGLWRQLVPGMRALAPDEPDAMRARRMQIEIARALAPAPAGARLGGWRGGRWAAALALAGAAALLAVWLRRPIGPVAPPPAPAAYATVVRVEGALTDGAGALAPASGLAAGSQLALARGGHAELALGRGSRLRIAGPARVVLGGTARAVALRLDEGTLDAEVAHRVEGETFAVVTPDLRVEVRGTRFTVGAGGAAVSGSPGSGSWVRVDQGRVEVSLSDGRVRSVAAGETLSSSSLSSSSASPAEAPAPAAAASDPAELAAPPGAGLPTPHASGGGPASRCVEVTRACEALARDARQRMRDGDQRAALRLLAGGGRQAQVAGRGGMACGDAALACRDELGYLHAEALRGVGKIEQAIGAYRHLDRRGAPAAMRQNALYATAELERRRGQFARARADYQRALAASPRGALREEAILGAMESAAAAGDPAEAQGLAARYLDEFPAGIGAARARQIRDGGRP